MKSPFPGMDPYLERHWLDVHPSLCTYARDALNAQLGGELLAHMGERIVVERLWDRSRGIAPDIRIIERGGLEGLAVVPSAVAVAEPVVLEAESEPIRQPYIEIRDLMGQVITVIEFLSPTNKLPGPGRQKYRTKQKELYNACVSLVEIDLTRSGGHVLLAPAGEIPEEDRAPYKACVFRGWRWEKLEYYPMPIRQRLPAIRIPLRQSDPDAVLDIQALVDLAYRNGRYGALLDYRKPCEPPLKDDDARWADELLARAGKR